MHLTQIRNEKINSLPNELREIVIQIEGLIDDAEYHKECGTITDGKLAAFYELVYIACLSHKTAETKLAEMLFRRN